MASRPITILACALGGEGGGVLAEWLYDTAVHSGHSAQGTSIPGVAQRTGATTYYFEVWPQPDRELGGRRPLFGLSPVPGAIDVLASSELLETVRQVGNGYACAERTAVITSSARALTVIEKMQLGDGRLDGDALRATVEAHSQHCHVLDMTALAQTHGTAISAVLFGAIAGSGRLPFTRAECEATIRRGGKGVEASLRGFAAAFEALSAQRAAASAAGAPSPAVGTAARPLAASKSSAVPPSAPVSVPPVPPEVRERFPAALHDIVALGHARLRDYQDDAYASLYLQRLTAVLELERAARPDGELAATRETARWLALWMAFDDIVRVAALKLRASRLERVRREVGVREGELLKVFDHFKPGVPELAALLPAGLAQRLSAWDAARVARGQAPWALPLKVGSHTVLGALALRVAAGLKGQRRRGSRFAVEQALIERWLAAVQAALREDTELGLELAQCGRLIKGYGSTNERGKHNLLHLVDHLAAPRAGVGLAERLAALRAARTAALADDGGRALDQSLAAHGARPRPLREQPIRWHRRRPAEGGARRHGGQPS